MNNILRIRFRQMKFPLLILTFLLSVEDSNGRSHKLLWNRSRIPTRYYEPSVEKQLLEDSTQYDLPPSLTVAICPAWGFGHVREIAVIIRKYTQDHIDKGELVLYEYFPTEVLTRFRLKYRIAKQTSLSLAAFTQVRIEPIPRQHLYLAELVIGNETVLRGSLTMHSSWMHNNMEIIGDMRLSDLAIPGTIGSGAYRRYMWDESMDSVIGKLYNQEEDVFTQLLYGIRALELHVIADSDATPGFWLVSRLEPTGHKLIDVLEDVQKFLIAYKHEIVFVDIRMHNTTTHLRRALYSEINSILGDLMYKRQYTTLQGVMRKRLRHVSKSGQRAIVTLRHAPEFATDVLPALRRIWKREDNLEKLRNYIDEKVFQYRREYLWFFNVRIDLHSKPTFFPVSRRKWAFETNFAAGEWFFLDRVFRLNVNLMSVEYFAGSDIVNLCVLTNIQRATRPRVNQLR